MDKETAFAHFMANAPREIPVWFRPEFKAGPKAPDREPKTGNEKLDWMAKSWRMDPVFDSLYEDFKQRTHSFSDDALLELRLWEDQWRDYWKENEKYQEECAKSQYWAWRVHYAYEMTARYLESTDKSRSYPDKFIVVSYDQDEQQLFLDAIEAESKEAALTLGRLLRGEYAFVCDALGYDVIDSVARSFENKIYGWISVKNIRKVMEEYGQEWPYEDNVTPEIIVSICPKCHWGNTSDVTHMYDEPLEPKPDTDEMGLDEPVDETDHWQADRWPGC